MKQNNDIKILYSDNSCVVINKPPGLLVHPLPGNSEYSVANWWSNIIKVDDVSLWPDTNRMGIVHRLDKDTSGALLLAKTPESLLILQKQFHDHEITKNYTAIVTGKPKDTNGKIVSKIIRNKKNKTKRVSTYFTPDIKAKEAISKYSLLESGYIDKTLVSIVEFTILTGRTHQIRLHAKMLGTPILGDADYSTKESRNINKVLNIKRQQLHANLLGFISPDTKGNVVVKAPMFSDMKSIIKRINNHE